MNFIMQVFAGIGIATVVLFVGFFLYVFFIDDPREYFYDDKDNYYKDRL